MNWWQGRGFPPQSFKLFSPPDGATEVSVNPTFSWEQAVDPEGESITYTITIISQQNTFLVTNAGGCSSYTMLKQLLPGTTYYWRITAEDPQRNSRKSSFHSFTTTNSGGGEPGGGQTFGLSEQNVRKVSYYTTRPYQNILSIFTSHILSTCITGQA